MKKGFLLFTFCLIRFAFALPIQDHPLDPIALCQLTSALNISQDADLLIETQKHWLRKPGQERWEVAELSENQKLFVLKWAREQGLFSSWKPLYKEYDKALILGASTSVMQTRLNYLKELWDQGIRFHEIVWLTGDRSLDPRIDDLTNRCKTESEAALILWEETRLPEEMRYLPVLFIAVPMKMEGPSLKRPNTEDTIIAWLKTDPQPCKTLFVSNQPFCGYQFAVIKGNLPDSFQFDVIGPGVDPTKYPNAAAILLDSIARWIYQESLNSNSKK